MDIALATGMLYLAAQTQAYDIAIAVVGDKDFVPVFQHVRRLGKRIAIASIRTPMRPGDNPPCAKVLMDATDPAGVKDYDLIWLEDHLGDLERTRVSKQVECESHLHEGDRTAWTDRYVRKSRKFYCDNCVRKDRAERDGRRELEEVVPELLPKVGELAHGKVFGMKEGRTDAFIRHDGGPFYFNADRLDRDTDTEWSGLNNGEEVVFRADSLPDPTASDARGRRGQASAVRIATDVAEEQGGEPSATSEPKTETAIEVA